MFHISNIYVFTLYQLIKMGYSKIIAQIKLCILNAIKIGALPAKTDALLIFILFTKGNSQF